MENSLITTQNNLNSIENSTRFSSTKQSPNMRHMLRISPKPKAIQSPVEIPSGKKVNLYFLFFNLLP